MNFEYYLGKTLIDSGDLRHFWEYDASSGSGDLTNGEIRTLNETSADEDFTLLFTYNKSYSGRCILLSNIDSSRDGFSFGLTDDNHLFIDTYSNNYNETFVFDQLNLGKKNTIILQKLDNFFSVFNYNIVSREIFEKQFFNFRVLANVSGDNLKIGGNDYYPQDDSFPYFTGTIDQLAYFSQAYEEQTLLKLLSGFQPETLPIETASYQRIIAEESILYIDGVTIDDPNYSYFYSYFTDFNSGLVSKSGDGIATITGGVYGTGWLASGYFGGVNSYNPCSISGVTGYYSYNGSLAPSGTFEFTDSISYTVGSSGDITVTHSIRYIYPDYSINPFTINHTFYETWGYVTGFSPLTIDSGYYDDFKMDGVVSITGESLVLGTKSGITPNYFSREASVNYVDGYFFALSEHSGLVGSVYLNGYSTGDFTQSGDVIDLTDYELSFGDYLIYDCFSGGSLLYYGLNGFASGSFYPRASITYSSKNSWTEFNRLRKTDYREITSINSSYGNKILNIENNRIYNNEFDFWNTGVPTVTVIYSGSYILLDSGSGYLLLENGGHILFEK